MRGKSTIRFNVLAAVAVIGLFWNARVTAAIIDATYSLGTPSVSGTVATMDVVLDFDADSGEVVVFFNIDVSPSDSALSSGGTDYSAFSFTPASPLLDDWDLLFDFNEGLFPSVIQYDTFFGTPLPSGVHTLGQLSVDFGGAGFAIGDSFDVAIDGFASEIGVELPPLSMGELPGFVFYPVTSYDPAAQTLTVIPEPTTSAIWSGLWLAGAFAAWRRRSRSPTSKTTGS